MIGRPATRTCPSYLSDIATQAAMSPLDLSGRQIGSLGFVRCFSCGVVADGPRGPRPTES